MQTLVEDGMTMLTVTHEMGFARKFANRVIFMDEGRLVEVGPPRNIFENPQDERTKSFLEAIARLDDHDNDVDDVDDVDD